MKIALIGASGFIGARLLAELSRRGHSVTAIVRNPEKVAALPGVTALKGDVFDKDGKKFVNKEDRDLFLSIAGYVAAPGEWHEIKSLRDLEQHLVDGRDVGRLRRTDGDGQIVDSPRH